MLGLRLDVNSGSLVINHFYCTHYKRQNARTLQLSTIKVIVKPFKIHFKNTQKLEKK